MNRKFTYLALITGLASALTDRVQAQSEDDKAAELAKQLQNPVASLISVPFQNNFDFNIGPNDDGFRYLLKFQPVFYSLSRRENLKTSVSRNDCYVNSRVCGAKDNKQNKGDNVWISQA